MTTETLNKLAEVVVTGKIKEAKPLAIQALNEGADPRVIIFDYLNKAMAIVGQKYETKQYYLPQVLLSAQTMYQVLDVVLPKMKVQTTGVRTCKDRYKRCRGRCPRHRQEHSKSYVDWCWHDYF